MVVAGGGVRRSARLAGVDDAVGIGRADIDLDVEQPLVHRKRRLFSRDVSG